MKRAFWLTCLGVALPALGCASLVGDDFDGYVPAPKSCSPTEPHSADPRKALVCRADETCIDGANGTASCVPIVATKPESAPCKYTNECGAGGFCALAGCLTYCRVGQPACASGAPCLPFEAPLTIDDVEYGYCAPATCDPHHNTCAGSCDFYAPTMTACFPTVGAAKKGEACDTDTDCVRGLACGDTKRCTPLCRVSEHDCAKSCLVSRDALSLDGVEYGYCEL